MPAHFSSGLCVRVPSWHRQETLLADYPEGWDDARRIAGIAWEPTEAPMGFTTADDLDGRPAYTAVTSHKAILRSDNGDHLGTVGSDWHPISHAVMGEVVEALLAQPNVNIDTMVCLRGGRQVAATIVLDEPYRVGNDDSDTLPYLVVLNAHDGSSAFRAMATQVRVVCANTYAAAMADGARSNRQFVFRHTARVMDRIDEAKQAIHGVRDDAQAWRDLANDLGLLVAGDGVVDRFLSEFIPMPVVDEISDRVRANIVSARDLYRLFYESDTCQANYGTGLGLVHAAVEYLDHGRGARSQDARINRQLLRPEPLKAKAVRIAREVCTA